MSLSYRETAQIAESLGMMLRAGLPLTQVFDVVLKHRRSKTARRAVEALRDTVMDGRTFHEGLLARAKAWPPYFIELVRCCEMAGMLHDGFAEGADHFRKMGEAWRAARNVWFHPTIILCFGWLCCGILIAWFLDYRLGIQYLLHAAERVAAVAVIACAALYIPPLRRVTDAVILHLPVFAELLPNLYLYRFTACFRYLYIGALPAPEIVRHAARAVGNQTVQRKILDAAEQVEAGMSFAEALEPVMKWPANFIEQIAAAEQSGRLEGVLAHLAAERKEELEVRALAFRKFFEPIVFYSVMLTLAGVCMMIANAMSRRAAQ